MLVSGQTDCSAVSQGNLGVMLNFSKHAEKKPTPLSLRAQRRNLMLLGRIQLLNQRHEIAASVAGSLLAMTMLDPNIHV